MAASRRISIFRILLGVIGLGGTLLLLAQTQWLRGILVENFSPEYGLPSTPVTRNDRLRLEPVAGGFLQVTDLAFVPGQRDLLLVLEKGGKARLVTLREGAVAEPGPLVLDVKVAAAGEMGLLGVAFHPRWLENGRLFVHLSPPEANLGRVVELRLMPDAVGKAPAEVVRTVLEVTQPYQNHNGGQLLFGPDGMLYIGFGDGGWMGDPEKNGQNPATWLGAMLRIDVDHKDEGKEYAVPGDNPFVGKPGFAPEVWAWGLRNPWRSTFAPDGRLVVADVGQNLYEEVDLVAAGDNLGWNLREADHCYAPAEGCPTEGLVDPIFTYSHDLGSSITGGVVYTGTRIPWLAGRYLFADFVSGRLWALTLPPKVQPAPAEELGAFTMNAVSFTTGPDGEVYVGDFGLGRILKILPVE